MRKTLGSPTAIHAAPPFRHPPQPTRAQRAAPALLTIALLTAPVLYAQHTPSCGGVHRPGDFDGDGKTDLAVFRPADTTWRWIDADSLAGPEQTATADWATADTVAVAGDFDGDGKTDRAGFDPTTGWWQVDPSGDPSGATWSLRWGLPDDIPVPADYDGDGKTDAAVFRPVTGMWYVYFDLSPGSAGQTLMAPWGQQGDIPVPADYDGDGLANLAIFRPADGDWWVLQADLGYYATHWGLEGDIPAPLDYDGDGLADLAVFRPKSDGTDDLTRPSGGSWYVLTSGGGGYAQIDTHLAGQPAPGDYDGDCLADLALFDNGLWWIGRSSAGDVLLGFGAAGDLAVAGLGLPSDR